MPSDYLSFARVRIIALTYITCLSLLTFAIVLFAVPTVPRRHVPTLAVIAVISFIVGLATCIAILAPKTQCCNRRSGISAGVKIYVGIEVLCCIASLLLLVTAIALEIGIATKPRTNADRDYNPEPPEVHSRAERTLSTLLLFFTCSVMLVATLYTGLIAGLGVYTHKQTGHANVWLSDAACEMPAFVIPPTLRFLRNDGDGDTGEAETERARRSQRVSIEQLEITPTLHTLLHQIRLREGSRHTLAPDCSCGEKLPWGPARPEDYRAVGQIYTRIWTIIAEREAQQRARTISRGVGRERACSTPVPILRLPTERERRRTVFLVAFDSARAMTR